MNATPVVLGINRTADGSICLIGDPPLFLSVQKERYTRQKHHWGKLGDLRDIYAPRIPELRKPIDLVVECYSSDPEARRLDEYHAELRDILTFRGEPRIIRVSHHLAHLYSTFFHSSYNEAAVMVIDFQGSRAEDMTESWPSADACQPQWVEVGSFYMCRNEQVNCIGKQMWDNDRKQPVGLGAFYNYLTHVIFEGRGMEGKVMGLAPYGDPHALKLPPLIVDECSVFIPGEWQALFESGRDRFRYFKDGTGSFEDCANLAAAGQLCFEEAQLCLAEWLYERTNAKVLCLAGGTALNCVANGRLLRESSFEDVFVPPSPHDGGTALGCATYGLVQVLGQRRCFEWVNDFLVPEPDMKRLGELLTNQDSMVAEEVESLIDTVVELLIGGKTVALYNGRAELGPRALGHRSILADPRYPAIRAWINKYVKGRELFRPLAPVVLEEAAHKFFDIDRPVPFMQFAVSVRPECRELISAVTHVDGSARLQTVSEREDPFLYALLKAFERATGIGVLLNTSLNGKGEPIVETPTEALECLESTGLHALVIPPYIVRKVPSEDSVERRQFEEAKQEELAIRFGENLTARPAVIADFLESVSEPFVAS